MGSTLGGRLVQKGQGWAARAHLVHHRTREAWSRSELQTETHTTHQVRTREADKRCSDQLPFSPEPTWPRPPDNVQVQHGSGARPPQAAAALAASHTCERTPASLCPAEGGALATPDGLEVREGETWPPPNPQSPCKVKFLPREPNKE